MANKWQIGENAKKPGEQRRNARSNGGPGRSRNPEPGWRGTRTRMDQERQERKTTNGRSPDPVPDWPGLWTNKMPNETKAPGLSGRREPDAGGNGKTGKWLANGCRQSAGNERISGRYGEAPGGRRANGARPANARQAGCPDPERRPQAMRMPGGWRPDTGNGPAPGRMDADARCAMNGAAVPGPQARPGRVVQADAGEARSRSGPGPQARTGPRPRSGARTPSPAPNGAR